MAVGIARKQPKVAQSCKSSTKLQMQRNVAKSCIRLQEARGMGGYIPHGYPHTRKWRPGARRVQLEHKLAVGSAFGRGYWQKPAKSSTE